MAKRPNESLIDYKNRVIDTISDSFCAAKWLNATTWLGSGTTASCHHPPAHKIPVEEVIIDISAIHNTAHKKQMRKLMLDGHRPGECEYCWKMEDMGNDAVSDRVFKTIIYEEKDIQSLVKLPWDSNVDLKTFEISFDRVCNLACSYCNASFSTTWARDIKVNGPYLNMVSDGAGAFTQDGSWTEPYDNDENNPYINAFWEWWDRGLSDSLDELRITGGEPLMSGNTWKLIDWFEHQPTNNMRFAINSNLIAKPEIIDKLILKSRYIKNFHLYTSCEAYGVHAEYIRDGFDYELWKNNIIRLGTEANIRGLHIMMTINSLCLFSITKFLDEVYTLKKMSGTNLPNVSLNLLRFPSFQSPLALPDYIKTYCRTNLLNWYNIAKHNPLWHEFERASIERLIDYLDIVDAPHRRTSNKITLWRDFKTFYTQYDNRRNKSIYVFPSILTEWFDSIPDTDVAVDELAEREGWVLKHPITNIKKPLGEYDE